MLSATMVLVTANEPLMVNQIPDSSFDPFIEFAVNDCGNGSSVKELVHDWIHLLFLKEKSAGSK